MVAPAEKASLLGSQFNSKHCREQFVTPLSYFPQSRCNSLVVRTFVLLRMLLDLDMHVGVDPLGVFSLFINKVSDIIAPKLSIIFRRLIRLGSFLECWQSANVTNIPKGASSPNEKTIVLCALESGQEARIVRIDFSAAFDRVCHQGILYGLCSVGIADSVLSILTQFLPNRSQHVMVDGGRIKLVDVVSGSPQGSVLGPLLFILYTSELFSIL